MTNLNIDELAIKILENPDALKLLKDICYVATDINDSIYDVYAERFIDNPHFEFLLENNVVRMDTEGDLSIGVTELGYKVAEIIEYKSLASVPRVLLTFEALDLLFSLERLGRDTVHGQMELIADMYYVHSLNKLDELIEARLVIAPNGSSGDQFRLSPLGQRTIDECRSYIASKLEADDEIPPNFEEADSFYDDLKTILDNLATENQGPLGLAPLSIEHR